MIRKLSILAFVLGLHGVTFSQVSNSECEKYRQIIENNITELNMDDFGRSIIVGKNNEYINPGLSKYFVSEPKVPDYIYTADNLIMKMVDIIIAHVDLYHCDVAELNKAENKKIKSPIIQSQYHLKVYPNPTQEFVNIEGDVQSLEQILLFNFKGSLVRRIQKIESTIDLSDLSKGSYYLYLISKDKIQSKKVIKM
jgi:hypothetical protein